jgi:hypothetical protein
MAQAQAQAQAAAADPVALRDDIAVRKVLELGRRTMRIAKDPRDNVLYTLTATGNISRVLLKSEDELVGPRIARGLLNIDTGEITWTHFDPRGDVPEGTPLGAVLAAGEERITLILNPIDDKMYALSLRDGTIVLPPRTIVAAPEDYGIEFPRALFIDAEGIFYIILDTELTNASSEQELYTSSDHGYNDTQGFDIGPDGSFYLGATTRQGGDRVTHAVRGWLDPNTGVHRWVTIASTEPIPPGSKNHPHPGVTVSPDGRFVFLNSGSRTDHGEMADGVREVPLSATILRVPADGEGLIIPADAEALRASGFLYADGFRNAFDTAFAGNGDLFAGDNGPDSDQPEAISWVREGHHYGFPWRIGGVDNPMRSLNYDPAVDNYILFTRSSARNDGLFYNDPDYPPPPMAFTDPVTNLGPDADRFRDPVTGEARDASDLGLTVHTLTPHSSPLGLVFDVHNALSQEFMGDGFVLRTGGAFADLINSFNDSDQDLLHMDLEKVGDNYQGRFTRIVSDFRGPIDTEIIGNKIFVVEWSGDRGLWEITLPAGGEMTAVEELGVAAEPQESSLSQNYPNPFNPNTTIEYQIDRHGFVELTIFDMLGREVRTLLAAKQIPGRYRLQWDGLTDAGTAVASGVYLYRLQAGTYHETRRLILLK